MKVVIKINTDNAAFSGDVTGETIRILDVLVKKLERNEIDIHVGEERNLYDFNGGVVGYIKVNSK
jgi:hypothetical protein